MLKTLTLACTLTCLVLPTSSAFAAVTDLHCEASTPLLPTELSGWGKQSPLKAATDSALLHSDLKSAHLMLDNAAHVQLSPLPDVGILVPSTEHDASNTYAGLLALTVYEAGTYRLALSAKAWVDISHDGKVLASVGHDHGPVCSGIRKIVNFALTPGLYTIQISGSALPEIAVMAVRFP